MTFARDEAVDNGRSCRVSRLWGHQLTWVHLVWYTLDMGTLGVVHTIFGCKLLFDFSSLEVYQESTQMLMKMLVSYAALALAITGARAGELRVNGWYPCGFSYENHAHNAGDVDIGGSHFELSDFANDFECAEIVMPLCHKDVCRSDETISVFVKRLPPAAVQSDGERSKILWLINGGPGGSSAALEEMMAAAQDDMDGALAVYTMDHRGTGRSHFLQCEAAQAFMDGSPNGATVTAAELPNCLRDLNFQYDHTVAAWSVTSAAMDLKKIIHHFHGDARRHEVYINGFSYGTFLLQRFIQIGPPPSITGLVFDGVDVLTTKNDSIEAGYSHDDLSRLAPSRRLLEYCFADSLCPLTLEMQDTVVEEVLALYDELDNSKDTNACAQLLLDIGVYANPSDNLRDVLWWRVSHLTEREFIPLILGKLQSCEPSDVEYLQAMLDPASLIDGSDGSGDDLPRRLTRAWGSQDEPDVLDPVGDTSTLLFNVIVASERWADPYPSLDELKLYYRGGPFSQPNPLVAELKTAYQNLSGEFAISLGLPSTVCLFQGDTSSSVCSEIKHEAADDTPPFVYARDKYYDAPMELANTTTVMFLNGDLDFQTPTEFGDLLWDKIVGARDKLAVEFNYGGHCRGEATAGTKSKRCRDLLVTQLIKNSGDVSQIDTSCLRDLPKIAFPAEYTPLFGADGQRRW